MKRTLSKILLILTFASSAFAWDPHSDKSLVGATSDSKNGLWFTANDNASLSVNFSKIASENAKFGYFTFESEIGKNGKFTNVNVLNKTELNLDANNGASFTVNNTDNIGFYMEIDGVEYSSIKVLNEDNGFHFAVRGTSNGDRTFEFYTDKNAKGDSSLSMTFDVEKSAAPSGQPLPGVISSLLIGGIVGAYFFRKNLKRNNKSY